LDLGFLSIAPVRRDQLDALLGELGVERVGVICPICDQALGALSEEARCERRFYERDLIRRSVRRAYGERPSAAGARQEDRASKSGLYAKLPSTLTSAFSWVELSAVP
jgi:hypothetical protein